MYFQNVELGTYLHTKMQIKDSQFGHIVIELT